MITWILGLLYVPFQLICLAAGLMIMKKFAKTISSWMVNEEK
jgi:hypothetical protein